VIGIVPAAGYGTRLGQLSGSKELLDVAGRPVIDYLVERMEAGGCGEIRIVIRPEKHDLREYSSSRGWRTVLGRPPHVGASVALALDGVSANELVALGFPDTLWEPLHGFALLRASMKPDTDVALGLFTSPDASRSDVVQLDETGRVTDILVKPSDPPSNLVWGCLVARAPALAKVGAAAELSDGLKPSIARRRVAGRYLSDRWLDVGLPATLARARAGEFSVPK
jgi:glucose-1-phosphate thymidylyltransferase